MKVTVTSEHRFDRTSDGCIWTSSQYSYSFFLRYLDVFDHVEVVARIRNVGSVPSSWKRADGKGVMFVGVPYFVGPWEYLRRVTLIQDTIKKVASSAEAVILRAPSLLSTSLARACSRFGGRYAAEILGDPWDVFAPGTVAHPLRPLFRRLFTHHLKVLCVNSYATAYVTSQTLQHRYPPNSESFTLSCSDVELDDAAFVTAPRSISGPPRPITIASVGSMAQLYKAHDILIDAFATCVQQGLDLNLCLIGDGQYRSQLESQATRRGLNGRICFVGEIPSGKPVRDHLDRADLFVLPSRTEGLPRAMIEAMARGLPCIGSTAGGIPELLAPEDLVRPGSVEALAEQLYEVVTDRKRMACMAQRNLDRARQYHEWLLKPRRLQFYSFVKEHGATTARSRRHRA